MLIDTHCHLDAAEFDDDREGVIARAASNGVRAVVIPAVAWSNFDVVRKLAHSFDGGFYALGIHPICVPQASNSDLHALETQIEQSLDDPRFVGIGEIGLDFFLPELKQPEMVARQQFFYGAQLDLAVKYQLPVILHVRRSQDLILKALRQRTITSGIAHAFNGSFQQARQFLDLGMALGFGGAMTFERALQIRRLASTLPDDALVVETDAPDIPPAWLGRPGGPTPRNEPGEVSGIIDVLADLRGVGREDIAQLTTANAMRVLPRLGGRVFHP